MIFIAGLSLMDKFVLRRIGRTCLKANRDFRSNCDNLRDFNGGHFELLGVAKLAERVHDWLPKYIIRLSENEKKFLTFLL